MKYKLTFKDKIYFTFHKKHVDRFAYLYSKIEKILKNEYRNSPIQMFMLNKNCIWYTNFVITEYVKEYENPWFI